MDTKDQVYEYILETLRGFDGISKSENTCTYNPDDFLEPAMKGKVLDSCFHSKTDSSELVAMIYTALTKAGFSPEGYLRQDYLKWTGSLLTKDKAFQVDLGVETLDDTKNNDGERWKLRQQGFHSKVYINIYDKRTDRS